jgi:hypothetical protein
MKGRKRGGGGYHSIRGWWDAGVQRVVKKWAPKLGTAAVRQAFVETRRAFEEKGGPSCAC